jgi:hypothetical protein
MCFCSCHEGVRGAGGVCPRIINIGVRPELASLKARPPYPQGNIALHPREGGWTEAGIDAPKNNKIPRPLSGSETWNRSSRRPCSGHPGSLLRGYRITQYSITFNSQPTHPPPQVSILTHHLHIPDVIVRRRAYNPDKLQAQSNAATPPSQT